MMTGHPFFGAVAHWFIIVRVISGSGTPEGSPPNANKCSHLPVLPQFLSGFPICGRRARNHRSLEGENPSGA
jgi:hypothetical protein